MLSACFTNAAAGIGLSVVAMLLVVVAAAAFRSRDVDRARDAPGLAATDDVV